MGWLCCSPRATLYLSLSTALMSSLFTDYIYITCNKAASQMQSRNQTPVDKTNLHPITFHDLLVWGNCHNMHVISSSNWITWYLCTHSVWRELSIVWSVLESNHCPLLAPFSQLLDQPVLDWLEHFVLIPLTSMASINDHCFRYNLKSGQKLQKYLHSRYLTITPETAGQILPLAHRLGPRIQVFSFWQNKCLFHPSGN